MSPFTLAGPVGALRRRLLHGLVAVIVIAASTVVLRPAFAAPSDYEISVADVAANEGNEGSTTLNFW